MNILSNSIYDYYLARFTELPFDNQFHLASRLQLWSQDNTLELKLEELRSGFTGDENPRRMLRELLAKAKGSPIHGSKNAAELRRPYFEAYPLLKTYVMVLFRLTFLQTIYQLDVCQLFFELFPRAEVEATARRLRNDQPALAILSTHAINFLYLYERVIKQDDATLNPELFLAAGTSQYDLTDKLQLQLLIYLYTHCVIGESKFYYRALPAKYLPVYNTMIEQLETVMQEHFSEINLDNKFEFLVAAQLVGRHSGLQSAIWDEAAQSLSPAGTFIVDRLNSNPQAANAGFVQSEHRNVLCIMAARSFKPLGS